MRVRGPLLALVVLLFAAAAFILWQKRSSDVDESAPERGATRVLATGIVYQSAQGEESVITLAVEQLLRRKRKLGVFSINPFYELVAINARLTVNLDKLGVPTGCERGTDLDRIHSTLLEASGGLKLGMVREILVDHLEIAVERAGAAQFSITAERATTGPRLRRIEFDDGLVIEVRGGQRLEARGGRWLRGSGYLQIRGAYELWDGTSTRTGVDSFFVLKADGTIAPLARSG